MPRGIRHGYKGSPEHNAWVNMRTRCRSPGGHDSLYYQGVSFCEQWDDFLTFLRDMGPKPSPCHQLDRRDNRLGYSPDNCRWVDKVTQMQNTRISKWWFVDGERFGSLRDAARKYHTTPTIIKNWCEGRSSGKYRYPPKERCWSELKYER